MTPEKKQSGEVCRSCGRMFNGQNPNTVSLKFLADLIGKRVRISSGPGLPPLAIGTLRRFDNYSMVVDLDDDGPAVLIFKGPNMTVMPWTEPT